MDFDNIWDDAPAESVTEAETSVDSTETPVTESPEAQTDDGFDHLLDEAFTDQPDESPEFTLPETDDDLGDYKGLPLAQTLAQTRAYARELASKAAEFGGIQEKFGNLEEVERAVDTYRGFFSALTDESGNIVYNPATGLPVYSAKPGLEKLAENSPHRITQMLYDINGMKTPQGESYLVDFLSRGLNIESQAIQDLMEGNLVHKSALQQPETSRIEQATADWVRQYYGEDKIAAFERYIHPIHGQDFFDMSEARQDALMKDAEERHRITQELETARAERAEIANQIKQAQELEFQQLQQSISTAAEKAVSDTRASVLDTIASNLAAKVQFSADEKQNQLSTGIVKTVLAAALDPALASVAEGLTSQLGVKIDQSFYTTLQNAANKLGEVERLKAFQSNPRLSMYRDDAALAAAQAQSQQFVQEAQRTLSGLALRVAKALGATAKQQSDAMQAAAQSAKGRPQVRGTAAAQGRFQPNFAPFSDDSWNYINS